MGGEREQLCSLRRPSQPRARRSYIPILKASRHSDCPAGAKGHRPCPKCRGSPTSLELPGVTHGQWDSRGQSCPLATASHQRPVMVSEHSGAERCLVSL